MIDASPISLSPIVLKLTRFFSVSTDVKTVIFSPLIHFLLKFLSSFLCYHFSPFRWHYIPRLFFREVHFDVFYCVINNTTCFSIKEKAVYTACENKISIFDSERLRMCDDVFHMKHPSGKTCLRSYLVGNGYHFKYLKHEYLLHVFFFFIL